MSQHDYIISNQGFPATRADINNVLNSIATLNSGTSAPATQYAGQMWIDTTTATAWILYIYDGADNIQLATINTSTNTVNFTDSALDVLADTTPQLGGNLDVNGNSIVSTSNGNITLAPDGTGDVVLSADTVKIGDANANATITTDGTGDLILNTNSGSSSGSITIADGANADITIEPNGTGDILLNADTVRVGDSGANATITSNGAGDLILNTNSGTNSGSITIADGANGNITIAGNGTSQIVVNAGAVGTPTIAPTGDLNTGIFFPSADTIAFTEGGTEAMRIDSDGDVGIGETNPEDKLHLYKASNDTTLRLEWDPTHAGKISFREGGTETGQIEMHSPTDAVQAGNMLIATLSSGAAGKAIVFQTDSAERMRIQASGGIINTASNGGGVALNNTHTQADPYGILTYFNSASPDNNTNYFLTCTDSTTPRCRIWSDGDLQNHDNSYGSISDERIKQDIRDSNSQWNDIKNIKIRNFKKKDDVRQYGENAWEQIGVVAQELETVSPKLIKHSDPSPSDILSDASFGTLYQEGDEIPEDKKVGDVKEVYEQVKSVKYSILYMKAIKALQEAMERIEQLETKNTSLEARLTALES